MVPHRVALDLDVGKVAAEGTHGSFAVLPRHVDYVAILEPGILTYHVDGAERYVAVDGGTLVKVGDEVRVSTRTAVPGDDLEHLERTVWESFLRLDEQERDARAALARIETHVLQEMYEFEEGA
jgi:F-type H+-transporting ATPase subunit epsilon